jgi:hypothetical protein
MLSSTRSRVAATLGLGTVAAVAASALRRRRTTDSSDQVIVGTPYGASDASLRAATFGSAAEAADADRQDDQR